MYCLGRLLWPNTDNLDIRIEMMSGSGARRPVRADHLRRKEI